MAVTTTIAAIEPSKAPWEWKDSERLALRSNDGEAASRVRANRARALSARTNGETPASPVEPYDLIMGDRDPHLFLRIELFDHLAFSAFADDRQFRDLYREMREARRMEAGLPDDFWLQLESITAAYRADRRREQEIARSGLSQEQRSAQLKVVEAATCRDRKAAMAAAESAFGPAFERFLYAAVARSMSMMIIRPPDETFRAVVMGTCR